MKKTIITVFAFLVIFGFTVSGAFAQTWTWQYAEVTNGLVDLFTVNPSTDALYGLSGGSAIEIQTGTSVTTGNTFDTPDLSNIIGIAVGYQGVVYAISSTAFGSCTPVCATLEGQQPVIPRTTGGFTNIVAGKNGKLFILYEDADGQYVVTGNPPVQDELMVKVLPRSLNLWAKGKWVTCQISLPGYDASGIDPTTIEVTQFEVDGETYPVSIFVDPSAPMGKAEDKLIVKFIRYDKTGANNANSFVGALSPLGISGKVNVTATIVATHPDHGTFSGQDTFQVIVPPGNKGRP
jgi:hypothetical protein